MASFEQRTCDVCQLVDRDFSVKECFWCAKCRAWICRACAPNWGRRIQALRLRAFNRHRQQRVHAQALQSLKAGS